MPSDIRRCFVAVAILLCTLPAYAAEDTSPAPPAWDPAAFKALDPAARVKRVREYLAWRDARLANFSCDVTSIVQNRDVASGELIGPPLERSYSIRRLGDKYLATCIADSGIAGDIPRRLWSRWDGVVFRTYTAAGNLNKAHVTLFPEQHPFLMRIEYLQLLGWRVPGKQTNMRGMFHGEPLTLPQWIDYCIENGKDSTPQAALVEQGRVTLIEIKARDGYSTRTFHLDRARDFIPILCRYSFDHKDFQHSADLALLDAQKVDGLWVPTGGMLSVPFNEEKTQVQEHICVASNFSLGTVKEGHLQVDMRPGAEVFDLTIGIAYRLSQDLKPTALPMADSKTGTARTATDAELAEALEVHPLKDDVSDAAVARRRKKVAEIQARNHARRRGDDVALDKPAPAFPAQSVWHNSEPLTWEKLKGKVVILHFFAEWCGPCKNDYPILARVHEGKRDGLVIIGIHAAGSESAKVKKLLEDYKITYPVCVDVPTRDKKGFGQTFAAMGAQMAPHAILVNSNGVVMERGDLQEICDSALKLLSQKTQ